MFNILLFFLLVPRSTYDIKVKTKFYVRINVSKLAFTYLFSGLLPTL